MQARIDALETELSEALEQQSATAEVLQVINSSPGDLDPVFEAMVQKAITLCDAASGTLWTCDGERFDPITVGGASRLGEWFRQHGPTRAAPDTPGGRLLSGERVVHIADVRQDPAYRAHPRYRQMADLENCRTFAAVGLRKEDTLLGMITAYRQEVRPFSDKQIALLENFAAQAVIAMENVRLITETREALEQQTAAAEVLGAITSSPGDLAPVFDSLLEKATRLCQAGFGILWTYESERFYAAALHGVPAAFAKFLSVPIELADSAALGDIARGHSYVHIADLAASDPHRQSPLRRATVHLGGARTGLAVPLVKEDAVLGIFVIYRQELRPFTDKQIAVLQNFAAQVVIAMENARLLTETREALEQQTAAAEVLQVINTSPGDLAPVFDAMLERAMRLCEGSFAQLDLYDGERFQTAAMRNVPRRLAEFRIQSPPSYGPDTIPARLIAGELVVHVPDLKAEAAYRSDEPNRRAVVDLGGARAALAVPLRKDNALVGEFTIYRLEARPFTDQQIALLQNFAAQAVIAIENARLITETREALEQQTATAEVLRIINSSPGDLAPVFDAILEKAHDLCGSGGGALVLSDGERFRAVAVHGLPKQFAEFARRPFHGNPITQRLRRGERVVHIPDVAVSQWDQRVVDAHLQAGTRAILAVPLRKDEALLGYISAARPEVGAFTDREISLLENFAAQAVIAMDNARLLDEIRQRQAELRVTFDNMGDGVVMFDSELRLAAWNRNFQELLDLPKTFLTERPSYTEYFRYLVDRGEYGSADLEEELSRAVEDTTRDMRFERTRPDGRVIEVRRNAVPSGGFVLIYGDITERKRAEAEIREARDTAENALQELQAAQASLLHAQKMAALGQLTAGIAHEIKNPLNFVNNFAGLSVELLDELKETTAPAVASLGDDARAELDEIVAMLTGNLEKIAEHGRRADGIVQSMLAHSRGGSGDWQATDINALVEEALNLAYHGARALDQSFNITMERHLDRQLAPIEVVPQDITRVLLNLISNGFYAAAKQGRDANGAFRPVLKVTTCDLGEAVEVRVRDNGAGIPPEYRDRLFQPFFTTKPTGEGTGLGLSISYDIVTQQHGGAIAVDSEAGAFTEFTIRLPRRHHTTAAGTGS
jgi:PAS domain S-box-containing protein